MRQFPVAGDRILRIGRSEKSNVVLNEDPVSRNHAMLQCSDQGKFYITDCGSRNGTFVNGGRVAAPVVLHPGDRIRIGTHEFTFHQEAAEGRSSSESIEKQPSTNVTFALSLITVLVVDIRDFTGLAQQVEASKLSQVTGTLFREAGNALQDLIGTHGIERRVLREERDGDLQAVVHADVLSRGAARKRRR